jgi:uncharacterized protein
MNRLTDNLHKIDTVIFASPKVTIGIITLITLFFAAQIPGVKMVSDFADLLPQEHPYIQLHNEIQTVFGGANNIILTLEVEDGTIFTNETLARIHRITEKIDALPGINHNMVTSVTHRNTRRVWLNETGAIRSSPHYDPLKKQYSPNELETIKNQVISNARVFGLLVSPNLKAALIRGTLNEGQLDYGEVFNALQQIREKEQTAGVRIYAAGQPVLVGWVTSYVEQVLQIFLFTLLIMLVLLVLYFRKLYGVALPLIGILVTSIWGLGILSLLGYHLDPLMLVIPFLISARAMSHGIQMVERYYYELSLSGDKYTAARNTFENLFRPGSLGVISDAIGLLLISLGSVPINDKLAIYASLWAFSIMFSVLILIPCVLEVLPTPKNLKIKHSILHQVMPAIADVVGSRRGSMVVLGYAVVFLILGAILSTKVQIGEAESGSPLLYTDHDYNVSSTAINTLFPGSEELFIIAKTDKPGGLKRPEVIKALEDLQNYMLKDPALGGAKGLPNLVNQVNRLTHNNDPRWSAVPNEPASTGGLLFMYMMSSPIPGALLEFLDTDEQMANMVFYYKDHKGETIRRAIHMVKQWRESPAAQVEGLTIRLAGGTVGVTAAINESAYRTNMLVIPAVFLLIFAFVTVFYWSVHAGWIMMLAMSFSTTLTYAYMGLSGTGINVNTVPIIAVGIGVGIDYSIYIMDRIRTEMQLCKDLSLSVKRSICTTGVAVGFTAVTLIAGVVMWVVLSDLRFQADAALLLIVMLILNGLAAWFLVPAWIAIFKPKFIVGKSEEVTQEKQCMSLGHW